MIIIIQFYQTLQPVPNLRGSTNQNHGAVTSPKPPPTQLGPTHLSFSALLLLSLASVTLRLMCVTFALASNTHNRPTHNHYVYIDRCNYQDFKNTHHTHLTMLSLLMTTLWLIDFLLSLLDGTESMNAIFATKYQHVFLLFYIFSITDHINFTHTIQKRRGL